MFVTITEIVPKKLTKFNTVRENLEPDIDPATGEFGHELETLEADNDAPHELPQANVQENSLLTVE